MTLVNPSAAAVLDIEVLATAKLPLATTPLSGSELMTLLQSGRNVYISVNNLLALFSLIRPISPPVTIVEGGTGVNNVAAARAALGLAAVGICAFIEAPTNQEYVLVYRAPYPMIIDHVDVKTVSGTCTLAVTINGAPVTNMGALAVTAANTHAVAGGANVVNVDDVIAVLVSAAAAPVNLELTVEATR